jgi:DNA-binding NarL/FixJ family response regulator
MAELDLPTLVLHSRGDQMQDFQRGRELAAGIRGARLVGLDSNNHIVLADEPAWPVFIREITAFLAPDRAAAPIAVADDVAAVLSPRELDILRLAAEGLDNDGIAAEVVLSVRTVERHLQNAYAKLGLQGRTARTAAVARLLSRA